MNLYKNHLRRWAIWSLLVGVSLFLPAAVQAEAGNPDWLYLSREERTLVEQAERLMDLCEFDAATSAAYQVTECFPESVEGHLLRIRLADATKRLDQEARYYANRIHDLPESFISHLAWARCSYLGNSYRAAQQSVERALKLQPRERHALLLKAQLADYVLDETDKSIELVEELYYTVPDYPDVVAQYVWELCYKQRSGNKVRLKQLLEKLSRQPRPHIEIFDYLAKLERRRLWFSPYKVVGYYQQAAQLYPDRILDAIVPYAEQLNSHGHADQAIKVLQAALVRAPRCGQARLLLGQLLVQQQQWDKAIAVVTAGLPLVQRDRSYEVRSRELIADAYYQSGRFDLAVGKYREIVEDPSSDSMRAVYAARSRIMRIEGRGPDDRIKLLQGVPILTQRGKYCGPASLSMLLGFWKKLMSQDLIAASVYTGLTGEPPQVIEEFGRRHGFRTANFEGSVDTWKELIDQGIPILWLQFLDAHLGGGHYVVIMGYDDLAQEFLVHDPAYGIRRSFSYRSLKESWYLPSFQHSTVLVPTNDRTAGQAVAHLKPTVRMKALDSVLYVLTGANLYRGAWPALFINVLIGLFAALSVGKLIKQLAYPNQTRLLKWLPWGAATMALLCNLGILWFRSGQAVSVLIAFYASCLTLIVLLIGLRLIMRFRDNWIHPKVLGTLVAAVWMIWTSFAVIDDEWWRFQIPPAIAIIAATYISCLELRLFRAVRRARLGPCPDPVLILLPLAKQGHYSARMALAEAYLGAGQWKEASAMARIIRMGRKRRPKRILATLSLLDAAPQAIPCAIDDTLLLTGAIPPPSDANQLVFSLMVTNAPTKAVGLIASSLAGQPELASWNRVLRLGRWPRLPGLPRHLYGAFPHVLLRVAYLVAKREHEKGALTTGAVPGLSGIALTHLEFSCWSERERDNVQPNRQTAGLLSAAITATTQPGQAPPGDRQEASPVTAPPPVMATPMRSLQRAGKKPV